VETGGFPISSYSHSERAVYLLGAEDHGLPAPILEQCQVVLTIPAERPESFNVAVAGSIVMFHRFMQRRKSEQEISGR
jgi:tRNA G18 (ribose-2'-O)-methylase SpoU